MSQSSRTITRRTVLRGLGVAMGLPLLDAMKPVAALAGTAPGAATPVRMAFLFFPNGVNPNTWTPKTTGKSVGVPAFIIPPVSITKANYKQLFNGYLKKKDVCVGAYAKYC